MSKDKLTYQIGVAPHPLTGKPAALVFFAGCDSQDEALEQLGLIAELMNEALGGKVQRVQ